jgi:hypothetical protein
MKTMDGKQVDTRQQQVATKPAANEPTLPFIVIPLPMGITRADRKRVNELAPQFLRD